LPGVTVISIAHRETLARFHGQRWHFEPAGEGGYSVRMSTL